MVAAPQLTGGRPQAPWLRRCRAVRSLPVRTWERIGLAALILALLAGFAVYPSFPTYDSVYSLVWGHEIVNLETPSFDAYRAPTEHPLGIAVGILLVPLGEASGRTMEFLILASYAALIVGVYRLARLAFTPLVGLAAALILLSRFDFANLAVRGYIDVPYIAALVWTAALEYQRPRRGPPVFLLLAAAGLMRPEAWGLALVYWLWMAVGWRVWVPEGGPPESRRRPDTAKLIRWLGYALAGPVIWLGFDLAVTGDALFSFHATSQTVGELGRSKPAAELPGETYKFLGELVKTPVIAGGIAGVLLAVWFVPRRAVMPLLVLATGLGTFIAIGLAGLAVIDRYLALAAVGLCLFAGFAVAGFTVLERSRLRVIWAAVGAVAVAAVLLSLSNTLRIERFREDLALRTDLHDNLRAVLTDDAVDELRSRGCAPIWTPTHKIVPDVRLILDLDEREVVSRNEPGVAPVRHGIAVLTQGRRAMELQGFDADTSALTELPPLGFHRVASSNYFTVFARCTDN